MGCGGLKGSVFRDCEVDTFAGKKQRAYEEAVTLASLRTWLGCTIESHETGACKELRYLHDVQVHLFILSLLPRTSFENP